VLVTLKGQTPLLQGDWPEAIRADDSLWTIEDPSTKDLGKIIHLTIYKGPNQSKWWT